MRIDRQQGVPAEAVNEKNITLINKSRVFLIAVRISSIDIMKKVMRYPAIGRQNVLENIKQKYEKGEKSRLRLACLLCLSQVIYVIRDVY